MSKVYTVAVLVGSLRKDSINRKVALALAELAPANLKLSIVEIGDLPLYNEDIDGAIPPAAYSSFRQQVSSSDAVLFVTPEYNRSVPAPLKNAIDVGSRPYGKSAWSGKSPISTMFNLRLAGASAAKARATLRLIDSFLKLPTRTAIV